MSSAVSHPLDLDDQLCFALYGASNAIIRAYRPRLKDLNLTYPQYLVMLVLWQDGDSPSGHIALRLGLAANAVTPLLDRLETAGLVQRRREDADKRIVRVSLTEAGETLKPRAAAAQQATVADTQLSPETFRALQDQLRLLTRNLERADLASKGSDAS